MSHRRDDDAEPRGPLLTFRLDRDVRQRLRRKLSGEERTLTEVVTTGLRRYVDRADGLAREAAHPVARGARRAVAGSTDLRLPEETADQLRELRASGEGELLSAVLAALYERGWPLRPLAAALGVSRQAVQVRVRRPVAPEVAARVPECAAPPAFPRRRPAAGGGRRPHVTIKIDQALRASAHAAAGRNGTSLSQVIDGIVRRYLRPGPVGEIELGDTTPTGPGLRSARRSARARRQLRRDAAPGRPEPGRGE